MKVTKKKKIVKKKETKERRTDDSRLRNIEEIVVGMGKELKELKHLYKRVKERMGL